MSIEEIKGAPIRKHKTKWDKRSTTTTTRQTKAGVSRSELQAQIMYRLSEDVNRACTRWEIARGTYVPDRQLKFGFQRFN